MLKYVNKLIALAVMMFLLAAPGISGAQVFPDDPPPEGMTWQPGMAVTLGVGLTDFTTGLSDRTDVGPSFDLRIIVGTMSLFGGEFSYRGAANTLDDQRLEESSRILSSALEASGRVNILPGSPVTPFVTAGVGWQGFSIDSDKAGGLYRDDDALVFPFSGGIQYLLGQSFLLDGRFTYRYLRADDVMIRRDVTDETVRASSWEAMLRGGYNF